MSRKAQNNKPSSKTGTAKTLEDEIQIYDTIKADLDFSEFWYTHKSKLPKLTTLVFVATRQQLLQVKMIFLWEQILFGQREISCRINDYIV